MLSNIHTWASKSKLNMAILLAAFAVFGVFAKSYLSPATATIVITDLNNVATCGAINCPAVTPTVVVVPVQ